MTVKELIEQLQKCDENSEVFMSRQVESNDMVRAVETEIRFIHESDRTEDLLIPRPPLKPKKRKIVTFH